MTHSSWRFEDPPNVAVVTTQSVVRRGNPILLVTHDDDDGSWQFHSGEGANVNEAMVVALEEIIQLDPSVEQLADLPCGWVATRATFNSEWVRAQHA